MKAKPTRMPARTNLAVAPANAGDDTGIALHGLAQEIGGVAEELLERNGGIVEGARHAGVVLL